MSWFALLRHAPAILAAANALRSKPSRAMDTTLPVDTRVDDLAREMQDLARQIEALKALNLELARRARIATVLAAISVVFATVAVIVAVAS